MRMEERFSISVRVCHLSINDKFSIIGEPTVIYSFEKKEGRTYLIKSNQGKKYIGHTTKVIKR